MHACYLREGCSVGPWGLGVFVHCVETIFPCIVKLGMCAVSRLAWPCVLTYTAVGMLLIRVLYMA